VSFGQPLPEAVLREAIALLQRSDCFLAPGLSLVVTSAVSLVGVASAAGPRVVIVNLTETPYDPSADVVIRGKVGEVLPRIAETVLAQGT